MSLGATLLGAGRCRFEVWAPRVRQVEVYLPGTDRRVPLQPSEGGLFSGVIEGVRAGDRYLYRLDGSLQRPDPASRLQPEGVHGPSEVVDLRFDWTDGAFVSRPLAAQVFYELHVGTFTEQGTLDAVIPHLDALAELGVTALELMPLATFPGGRNWGYDGVNPFAVHPSYGGPAALMRLVDACHARGLAVVLDVVYNHLGPEGNYLHDFGPYFTDAHRTPWGDAVNVDGAGSDQVRRYFVENALQWVRDFHLDGLRLDAVHAIIDTSARPFLAELVAEVEACAAARGRQVWLIAESDANDPRTIRSREARGLGFHAQWADDAHHALHALLTGERDGYYADFGQVEHLARALRHGFHFEGQPSRHRGRRHGAPARDLPGERFVICAQNHDQVGNRMLGRRLSVLAGLPACRLAASVVLLAPRLPLLFMGEEYGETAPFLYFTSHGDPDLVRGVREGRKAEFAAFGWQDEPPDPQDPRTFERSRLDHALAERQGHRQLRALYAELLRLRREVPALADLDPARLATWVDEPHHLLTLLRGGPPAQVVTLHHFGDGVQTRVPLPEGHWRVLLDGGDPRFGGQGRTLPDRLHAKGALTLRFGPRGFAVLAREP